MVDSRAASRYVKSLLSLAVEKNVLDQVHNDMLLFSQTAEASRELQGLLNSPIIKHDKKLTILEKIFKGKVSALTLSFIEIITKKNREPLLYAISKQFHESYNEFKGIGKATITTAVPLDPKLRAQFEQMVKGYSNTKQVELIEKVDKEMIGGFVLNVGDRQIDASMKNKLKALKLEFSQNPYIKEY